MLSWDDFDKNEEIKKRRASSEQSYRKVCN